MRWLMWIIIVGMALLWVVLPATAQTPAPYEIRIYQDNPTGIASTWAGLGQGPETGYTGLAMVAKRFQCPVPECRYSSNVDGECPNPLDLPGANHPAGIALRDLGTSPAQRFAYWYADFDANNSVITDPVTSGLIRPFHPGDDNDPQTATATGGSRLRIQVVRQLLTPALATPTGGFRLRVMPPGVRKPMAMSWLEDPDHDELFAVRDPLPGRTDINLIDSGGNPATEVDPVGHWWTGYQNAILVNPATCPTARWTIRFGDSNGNEEIIGPDPAEVAEQFTLYRGDPPPVMDPPGTGRSDGWSMWSSATRPTIWVSFSEEVGICFDGANLNSWLQTEKAAGELLPTITFWTYSNCVYLPYPSLTAPTYPNAPDNYFTAADTIQDVDDAAAGAADQSTPTEYGFVYEPRIGETGLGRVDVQERINQSPPNDPDGNPVYVWRPYDVDRDALDPAPAEAVDVFVKDDDDGVDSDLDGRTDDYIDRSLHAFFFCSRQETPALVTDLVTDGFMPILDLASLGDALPGSTMMMPPGLFPVANRATQQVLRCPNCGAVHPIDGDTNHPVAPAGGAGAGLTPPHADHSFGSGDALENYCEFCGTSLELLVDLTGDGDFDDPGEHVKRLTESETADVGVAGLSPLRSRLRDLNGDGDFNDPNERGTLTFSRASLGETALRAEIPFENVLFGPLTPGEDLNADGDLDDPGELRAETVAAVAAAGMVSAALGVRIPSFQPPSEVPGGTDNPYNGIAVLYETQDEHNRRYYEPASSPTGDPDPDPRLQARQTQTGEGVVDAQRATPLGTAVTREHLLFDSNGTWDTYYLCPDCGSKQSLPSVQYDQSAPPDGDFDDPGERAGCLNSACQGHSFCPVHGGYFAPEESATPGPDGLWGTGDDVVSRCMFWRGNGTARNYVSATPGPDETWDTDDDNQPWPNARLDENSLTAEEYEPVRIQLSVPRVPAVQVAGGPVQLGDVSPGSAAAPHGALNADLYPQETSRSAALPVENAGNVVLDNAQRTGVAIDLTTVGFHPTTGAPIPGDVTRADALGTTVTSSAREQQSVPVNTGGQAVLIAGAAGSTMQPVDHAGDAVAALVFSMVPAYPEELAGSRFAYVPGAPPGPGPGGLRGGNPALAALRPLPNGTPVGEYAGLLTAGIYDPGPDGIVGNADDVGLTIRAGAAPVRLRVAESRLPANSVVAADASPSAGIAPPGSAVPRSIVAMWTSNGDPPGAPPPPPDPDWPQKRPHNIWRVDAEPWTAPVNDPFYDHREWDPMGAGATVVAPQPAETAANAFHVEPFTVFDVLDPTSSWLYWHARRLNGLTGEWDSSVGVASDSIAPYLYDTGARVRGLRALVLQDPANRPPAQPVPWHWLFWHSGEEGQQRIGFNPCFDPDAPRVSVREELLRLTNARLGSAEPRVIEYRNYTGADALTGVEADTGADPLAAFQAAFDPDGDTVIDPLVRKPASNPFTFTKDPWVVEYAYQPANALTARLHVFYSAGLRHQRNSDICWSMFDAFAGGQGVMTDPAANYGKIAFRRLDASNGKRLLPFSSVSALRNHPWMRLGERLANDGGWQTFTSRHPDWVISRYYPMPLDPVDPDYWNGLSADRDGDGAPELLNTRWSGIIDRDPATLAVDPDRNPYDVDPVIYVVLIVDSLYDPADDVYRNASVHVARQVDWDPAAGLSMVELDPNAATPVYPMPLMWDPRDRKGNYYDERTGLVHITPLNLSPDPALSAAEPVPVTMTIDPSAGVVKFSRPLFNEHDPGDPRAVFHASAADNLAMGDIMGLVGVQVWLDYQPFTYRITTDGNADESPAAVFDDFRRLAVFWQRRQSGVGDPDKGAPSFMYKTYNTAVQVLRPPITADPTVEVRDTFGNWLAVDPPGGWPGSPSDPCWLHAGVRASGIIHFDGGNLDAATRVDVDGDGTREQPQLSLPAEMRVTYDDLDGIQRTERHCVVGWSKEMRAPTAAVVSEGPVTVTPETYTVNTDGEPVDVVKYWLFWTSTRGLYAPGAPPPPAVGFLGDVPASDVYYGVMAPTFGSAVPE